MPSQSDFGRTEVQTLSISTPLLVGRICLKTGFYSSYNWDPLSFGVTAAIGVLALIVALTTVFQGTLAAGPGRLKASRSAIGAWANFTETRFSWTEIRIRSTAFVPFVDEHLQASQMFINTMTPPKISCGRIPSNLLVSNLFLLNIRMRSLNILYRETN